MEQGERGEARKRGSYTLQSSPVNTREKFKSASGTILTKKNLDSKGKNQGVHLGKMPIRPKKKKRERDKTNYRQRARRTGRPYTEDGISDGGRL